MNFSLKHLVKGLGVIYLFAFLSLVSQVIPLFGQQGILPIAESLPFYTRQLSNTWMSLPSVFWFWSSDIALISAVWLGVLCSGVMILGRRGTWVGTIGAWILYLSFVNFGMPFMSFQWDILLLEAGFLAVLVELGVSKSLMVWAFRLLVFRVMFASGVVKWASGDLLWRNFEAMSVHYLTQPIPHIGAWYADKFPFWFQKVSTVLVFVVELVMPFFMFGTLIMRRLCAGAFIGLMVLVALTGNYTFFNMLMVFLSVSILIEAPMSKPSFSSFRWGWAANALVVFVMCMGVFYDAGRFVPSFNDPLATVRGTLSGFRLSNGYGLFAVMTPQRDEISIQGSVDGKHWEPYVFKYKPEALNKAPQWVWPHQPRLDWQMWFAALSTIERNYWLQRFAVRLLEGNTVVTQLLEHNPFEASPPNLIKMEKYRYRFSTLEERTHTGYWWQREHNGTYCFPVALPRTISAHE